MGNVNCSIPTRLAMDLKSLFGLKAFVESGLGQGTSALWASHIFSPCISIESDHESANRFDALYPDNSVEVVVGDSGVEMILIASSLTVPALFWLDGHTDDYTPVLAELRAINSSTLQHVIMVDDWRLFDVFPKWPSKQAVIELATNDGARGVYDLDDVLVAYPI